MKNNGQTPGEIFTSEFSDLDLKTFHEIIKQAIIGEELIFHYQPKVGLFGEKSGKVVGLEALLRWEKVIDGKKEMIFPVPEIIDTLEERGAMGVIGDYLLKVAVQDLSVIKKKTGLEIPISVNVVPEQIIGREDRTQDLSFVDYLSDLLKEENLSNELIELELVERDNFFKGGELIKILSELKSQGHKISLDDYGTGHNQEQIIFTKTVDLEGNETNEYLIDKIKADRSLIWKLGTKEFDPNILYSIIFNKLNTGMDLVVEGVENASQLEALYKFANPLSQTDRLFNQSAYFLSFYGPNLEKLDHFERKINTGILIDSIQGWYFSKACPLDKIIELINFNDFESKIITPNQYRNNKFYST